MKKNFYHDVKAAEESEVIVVEYLTQNGYYVEDVRHLKNYQVRSVDYVALADQQAYTIEVKDDQRGHQTGNFIIELESGSGKPGWFKKCVATTLAIVSKAERTIFMLSMVELKQYMGNFIIELESGSGKPGWFKKCVATTLAIVSKAERTIFMLSMVELKQYIKKHRRHLREVVIRDYNTDGTYEAFKCVLIPRQEYEKTNSVARIPY